MSPQQPLVHRQTQPCTIAHRVQLTYKLFLLENARNTLERELRNFTSKAYEEVQGFLSSSFPTTVFSDLASTLDMKCRAVDRLSVVLKELSVEPHISVQSAIKNVHTTNQSEPHTHKEILKTDVLKFGPMLQNVLMASSIAKAVQVLGATLSFRQLKHFLISPPAAVQDDDMICSISSSYNSPYQPARLSCHLKAEEEQAVILEEKCQPENAILSPAIISPGVDTERLPLLLPPIQAIFPEISNHEPMEITPLISWGKEDDVAVQHQKQTSSQLLHFLRAKAKIMGALEVTVMEWNKNMCTSGSSQQTSPTMKTQKQLRQNMNDGLINTLPAKTLCADIENEPPVFKVKRVESSGSLTYSCVIATRTELWDIGDIFTEVGQGHSDNCLLEEKCENTTAQVEKSCTDIQWKTQCSEPEKENSSDGVEMPVISSIKIPEFKIRRFEETEVVVSYIVSPGNFYIQHADSITKLQALVTDWRATSSYALQNCIPDIGTQVMGWFPKQEQWCRAQVTKICGVSRDNNATDSVESETSIKVEVKRLDYGDTACLSLLNIKELPPEMATLPLQAVQVSMANVTPVNGRDWSEEAVGWFKAMVRNRTLFARLYPQGPKVTVELFLEKGKLGAMRRGASLSLRLAQNGHAKHDKLKNVGLKKISAAQLKTREQDSNWEKYLISCYTQNKK